ncbi:prolyl oligopeptidase family serine peptidase [Pseudonocardia hispaniensis]|uniref:Prolyl oligopeptidase family serine peptidase n=1 Tax=Pseudonocardia hispaniensis TaxID=904933 RepID=A0ABW1IX82_9PSEU
MTDSFPRRQARTRRFTLGAPRSATLSPDGRRVVFLRSRSGTDPVTCLWTLDLETGEERLVADPRDLESGDEENLPAAERARRERTREQAGGIVGYATDRAVTMAAFTLSGQLYVADFVAGLSPRQIETAGGVIDPRPDPFGQRVAFVAGGALQVHELTPRLTTSLVEPDGDGVTWGLADFIAAEEMGRMRGYWWSPDGDRLLVARVDETPVRRWHIADPANPEREPTPVAYPAAGTANAEVTLHLVGLDRTRTPVTWDTAANEYLVGVTWDAIGLLVTVQPRDQRALRVLRVDTPTGATTEVVTSTDDRWVDIVPGVPAHLRDGELVWTAADADTHRLLVDGEPVTPPTLQVRELLDIDADTLLFSASRDPISIGLWTWSRAAGLTELTPDPGVHGGRLAGGTLLVTRSDLDTDGTVTRVRRADGTEFTIASRCEPAGLTPRLEICSAGERDLRTAVLLPSWHRPGHRLPVLMDPYGGPHAQRVLAARNAHLTSQWFADQGFAVVVVDGRGTPGRGPAFERAVQGDLATPVLDDQIDALHAVAARNPDLDLDRVGIRGWSFGGYLAALAVLRRPDVFHAAVAGAPVTDWRLYDTHYTERYLGHPDTAPQAYERSSLFADAAAARTPHRPLLLVHGLADDNVVAAHTLRLSSALLAAGRPHSVLPLSGVTHMTPQEVVAENLLALQVEFLRSALGVSGPDRPAAQG